MEIPKPVADVIAKIESITFADVIAEGQKIDQKIAKALLWLKSDPLAADIIKSIPAFAPVAGKLIGLIPIVGEVEDVLMLAGTLVALEQAGVIKPMDASDLANIHKDLEHQ